MKEKEAEALAVEERETFRKRLFTILNHLEYVKDDGKILINALIDEGDFDLARRLAEAISRHDVSKFSFVEFDGMFSGDAQLLKLAINHHRSVNRHHLQYHADYRQMNDVDIAEMIVDQKARSREFGKDLRDFFKAFVKDHDIPTQSNFYQKANRFINLILTPPFKKVT